MSVRTVAAELPDILEPICDLAANPRWDLAAVVQVGGYEGLDEFSHQI